MTDNTETLMSKKSAVLGLIYLPVHAVLLPLLVQILAVLVPSIVEYEDLVNLIAYTVGTAYCMVFMFDFLKKSFAAIFDRDTFFLRNFVMGVCTEYVLRMGVVLLLFLITKDLETLSNPNNEAVIQMAGSKAIIITTVLLAPILEECLFRASLFGTVRKRSKVLAYAVTTVLFAVYHLWPSFVYEYDPSLWLSLLMYVPAGIVLCRAYDKTGNIWCPIAIHVVINFISMYVINLLV